MTAPLIINYQDIGVPTLSGTEGSLSALLRYAAPLLGWDIIYDTGLIIVIRPKSYKGGQQLYYRFDDRAARGGVAPRIAMVQAYESMSDIDTGVNLVGPGFVSKSPSANTTAQPWRIIGDQYGFYLITNTVYFDNSGSGHPQNIQYLGFINGLFPNDIPVCALMGGGDSSNNDTYSWVGLDYFRASDTGVLCYIHRDLKGTLNPAVLFKSSSYNSYLNEDGSYPSTSCKYVFQDSTTTKYMLPYPYKGHIVYFDYIVFTRQTSYGVAPEGRMPGFYAHAHASGPFENAVPFYPNVVESDSKRFVCFMFLSVGQRYGKSGNALMEISEGFRP